MSTVKEVYHTTIRRFKDLNLESDVVKFQNIVNSSVPCILRAKDAVDDMEVVVVGTDIFDWIKAVKDSGKDVEIEVVQRNPKKKCGGCGPQPEEIKDDYIARDDEEVIQWGGHRSKPIEMDVHAAWGQFPFFFRPSGSSVDLTGIHCGSIFLVLNGPSLTPAVRKKLEKAKAVTFGVNNGPVVFPTNFWACVDDPTRFHQAVWRNSNIMKFVPMAHFIKPVWDQETERPGPEVWTFPNVVGYRRNERFEAAQFLHQTTVNWGNHGNEGGGRSVMLAAIRLIYMLGFRTVYLVGCDWKMNETTKYFFEEDRDKGAISGNNASYAIIQGFFRELQPYLLRNNFFIFNCTPDSKLTAFPKMELDAAIEEHVEDHAWNFPTKGLYVDRYKKPKPEKPQQPPPPAPPEPLPPAQQPQEPQLSPTN